MSINVDINRIRELNEKDIVQGPLVYWMSRDQRANDNWALLYTQQLARDIKQPMLVIFCLVENFLGATKRQYDFMLQGLKQTEQLLNDKNMPFILLTGKPEKEIPDFLNKIKAGALVTDFDPLKIKKEWKKQVLKKIDIPFYEVDAHNIVPCFNATDHAEYAARTIRPKIHDQLDHYLSDFPKLIKHYYDHDQKFPKNDWQKAEKSLQIDTDVTLPDWLTPGADHAAKVLDHFIDKKLNKYSDARNDPTLDGQSNLSPYIHFGHISAQRIALQVKDSNKSKDASKAFLEELIVRKELADNFCYHNENYDNFEGFPQWAKETLNNHRKDKREHLYTIEQLENADTHDDLWNASQIEMIKRGKMHGYMRMYWAKKILEWTKSPEQAMEFTIYLNDKYEIDGRAPNGYTNISWCIGGVHDHAWQGREIFGKIRYMSYNGCKRKFDVQSYVKKYQPSLFED